MYDPNIAYEIGNELDLCGNDLQWPDRLSCFEDYSKSDVMATVDEMVKGGYLEYVDGRIRLAPMGIDSFILFGDV